MVKDKRYKAVKNLIESGHITLFREIFDTLPKSVLAKDMGMNNYRFTNLMNNVESFLINDLFRIADFIETEKRKILEVVYNQYVADNKNKKRVTKNTRGA